MFPRKPVIVRNYSRALRLVRKGEDKKASLVNYDDMSVLKNYLDRLDLTLLRPRETELFPKFKHTGRNLISIMQSSLASYELLESKSLEPSAHTTNTKDLNRLRHLLHSPKDRELYEFLKRSSTRSNFTLLMKDLSPLEVSLAVKRLTSLMDRVVKWYILELQYISRISKDADLDRVLKTKSEMYSSISKIFRRIQESCDLTTIDYENMVNFHAHNLRYLTAIKLISEIEGKILKGAENLQFTKSLWINKLKILGHADEKAWRINRYHYKEAEMEPLPKNYIYPHHGSSVQQLLQELNNSGLQLDIELYETIILSLAGAGEIDYLQSLIDKIWGIGGKANGSVERGSTLYPTFGLLEKIIVAFTYNGQFMKGLLICMKLIEKYQLDLRYSQKYWTGVLRASGVTTANIYRDIQTKLWEKGVDEEKYKREFELQHEIFDLLWRSAMSVLETPSKDMIKVRLRYSSLESLVRDLPQIHELAVNAHKNTSASEAAYRESLLLRYLNICRVKLVQRRNFYEAEMLIKKFSMNQRMESALLFRLKRSQQRYLRDTTVKKAEQRILEDEDEDGFGIW
ncbi:hypothetical protein KL905_002123 [Ogataea polymorpha]|uniref:ATPase expression protein 2, mitochondrial n=2 Tax=Ogataea polymorpha TaxID=460523 RepID=A0A9P8PS56_9ASCO|nr:hypothetical protein KL937_001858 [Ogataea polymorpha]KAG7905725.1 hypothetical protein KL907_002872 [Ogataea polymorpha]KAG7909626.1 hypothetical protein KL906_002382 [Ogataea polymorpha]KAG7917148.1 hypothetical protein KL927_002922 [Ogataea polymorpha]KAG7922101.1 hypothetical protein KL905_002123 [Ogataea polymorpha]